jgi:hypothetical protein
MEILESRLALSEILCAAPAEVVAPAAGCASAAEVVNEVPALHSFPQAPAKLYLDFDGDFLEGYNRYTPPYDTEGDPARFSPSELDAIRRIWEQVSEDYSPFALDVTTEEPASFEDREGLRVAIGGRGDWIGGTYGGLGSIGAFSGGGVNTVWVFSANLGNGDPKYTADAASHEAGHAFGLDHQRLWDAYGNLIQEYYSGPGDGTAPIMGNSYGATRGLWWAGWAAWGVWQEDMEVIAG